tara:strand:+ start:23123 stop:25939 length:2817 start_codon:yes stop_codon:yes gene_type:complete
MDQYKPKEIEKKWQKLWSENKTFRAEEKDEKEKYYVLDMFPYPSGEGLHVGHPLGYIASDIVARYKRHLGYNVLHPMGYDSFGLPAEQYAIQTGQHPEITTQKNITRYRQQLDRMGFSFDWDREIKTSDPKFYKWTQWMFRKFFNSWYNKNSNKAENIKTLVDYFASYGSEKLDAFQTKEIKFSKEEWSNFSLTKREEILMNYRMAYLSESMVNWCEDLGTVLANDEVKDGLSERGGYPVIQKKMMQWSLRISAYSERLIQGLDNIEFSPSLKEQQKNWIGKSEGSLITFKVYKSNLKIEVFTTRPDTIFGVSFLTLAPESDILEKIITKKQEAEIKAYIIQTSKKSERDRQADQGSPSGVFTGSYAIHPLTEKKIPIWISEYVLSGYGTGAVMAVPSGDQRDYIFAKKYRLNIPNIFKDVDISESAYVEKDVKYINSSFINECNYERATKKIVEALINKKAGIKKINYRLRDAIFSRQRYWGEPFPIYYENNIPKLIDEDIVTLPKVDQYLPTSDGEPPLARAKKEDWNVFKGDRMETNTMPGWAGSSWYFLRFMDPKNNKKFASKEKTNYWNQVDLYIGGAEHAVGHLLYSRFWTKFLFDLGEINFNEPFKKLVNQGMIGGAISYLLLAKEKVNGKPVFLRSLNIDNKDNIIKIPCHIDFVSDYGTKKAHLNKRQINMFVSWRKEFKYSLFETDDGYLSFNELEDDYIINVITEYGKMSKRYFNTIDPEKICDKYGADTLRCYEMFLGPIEEHKPWSVNGISGVDSFLKKTWKLFQGINESEPTEEQLKTLHKTIKKVTEDIDSLSFNTVISTFMIAVNQWIKQKCNNKEILSTFLILLSPFAPHICEEIWEKLGNKESISKQKWPKYNKDLLIEKTHEYPISFNGKMRFKIQIENNLSKENIEKIVLNDQRTAKYLDGNPKKVIVIPGKIVNIVI